ncbi:MAG: type II toxin-antitoxin system RelE/ParE family toxin [Bacteroidota bacterium]
MRKLFEIIFLEDAREFLKGMEAKHYEKILFNIRKAQVKPDKELFSKLKNEIWEFRTLYHRFHYRLLSFWGRTEKGVRLVVTTHGFIKKSRKTPDAEIKKAIHLRDKYLKEKQLENYEKN